MPAYLIVSVHVSDPEQFKRYSALAPGVVASHQGRYLVRGGRHEVVEGAWLGERQVVIEFPDYAAAKRFFDSPDYARARAERVGACEFNAVIVEGVSAQPT